MGEYIYEVLNKVSAKFPRGFVESSVTRHPNYLINDIQNSIQRNNEKDTERI